MAYDTPWSWVPPDWEAATAGQPGVPLQPLQPGIGVPVGLLEQAVPPPQEIEMPAMNVSRPPEPYIGFPSAPAAEQSIPSPLDHEPTPPAAYSMPPEPADATLRLGMQPGLGIPAHLVDQAAIGAGQADFAPLPPEPTGEIEMTPDQLTEEDRRASIREMSDPDLAEFNAENLEASRASTAAKLARAAKADAEGAEAEFKIYTQSREQARAARAEVETEAARLADDQIDTRRWAEDSGKHIGLVISAMIGGLVAGKSGGRNDGMALIERVIERDVEEQKANLANKRAVINDKRAAANDQVQNVEQDFRALAAHRAASWERTLRVLDAEQNNYDQGGTSWGRIEVARREVIAKQQAALAAYEEREIKRMEAEGKNRLEIAKFVQKSRDDEARRIDEAKHHRASERAAQTSAGASYLTAKTGAKKAEAEIKAMEAENVLRSPEYFEASGLLKPPHEMTAKQHKNWLESKSKSADVTRETAQGVVKAAEARLENSGPSGSPYAVGLQEGEGLLQKDGKTVFEIKAPAELARARELVTAAQNIRRVADLVKIIKAEEGGASSTVGSKAYQELVSAASQIDFETFKAFGLGAPSAGDKALAEGARGGKDITSFIYDAELGFETYAQGIEEKATTQLRPLGYTGPAIKFKRAEAAKAMERTQIENMDAWSPPELLDTSVDPAIRNRAAVRAVESAEALARQSEPHLIRQYARENKSRLAEGLLDEKQAEKAHKALRKVYGRKLRDAVKARDEDAIESFGVTPALTQRKLAERLSDEQFYDLLIAEGDE